MTIPLPKPLDPTVYGLETYGDGLRPEELQTLVAELARIEDAWFTPGFRPERTWDRLLLHVCCGPCATFPLHILKRYGGEIGGLFYNPNIHPAAEYERRRRYAEAVFADHGIRLDTLDGPDEARWRSWSDRPKTAHCGTCYAVRMQKVAEYAARHGFDTFGTILTVSPYQDYERLTAAGEAAARRTGVRFAALDWRPGYRVGQLMARRDRIYRQKYCGCIYSIGESSYCTKICRTHALDPAALPTRARA